MTGATTVAVNGTPMGAVTADIDPATNRRAFLTQAAGAALLVAAIPTVVQATAAIDDPIFAAIEHHRIAAAKLRELYDVHAYLEKTVSWDKRRSSVTVWEEIIVETDDPRWTRANAQSMPLWMKIQMPPLRWSTSCLQQRQAL